MTITNKFSTVHTTAKSGRAIKYIVIHYTAGVTSRAGSAVNTADYFRTTSTQVSSDFTVDDTAVVQYNPDIKNRYTWHCGGSKYNTKGGSLYGICKNSNSIGIEICCNNSTGKMQAANDKSYSFSGAAVANALWLVKKLMAEYNIPAERVIRHYDVTGKQCPLWYVTHPEDYTAFKDRVKTALSTAEKPAEDSKMYYVQVGAFSSKANAEKYLETVKKDYPNAFIKTM